MAFHVYSSKDIVVTLNGVPLDPGGYAEEFVRITYNEDAMTLRMGGAGGATRAHNSNRSARIELSLLSGAVANSTLSAFHAADVATGAGIGVLAIVDMKSLVGGIPTTLFEASHCWVVKYPDVTYGLEAPDFTWILETEELIAAFGTNLYAPATTP